MADPRYGRLPLPNPPAESIATLDEIDPPPDLPVSAPPAGAPVESHFLEHKDQCRILPKGVPLIYLLGRKYEKTVQGRKRTVKIYKLGSSNMLEERGHDLNNTRSEWSAVPVLKHWCRGDQLELMALWQPARAKWGTSPWVESAASKQLLKSVVQVEERVIGLLKLNKEEDPRGQQLEVVDSGKLYDRGIRGIRELISDLAPWMVEFDISSLSSTSRKFESGGAAAYQKRRRREEGKEIQPSPESWHRPQEGQVAPSPTKPVHTW